jgi:hypothetical protein
LTSTTLAIWISINYIKQIHSANHVKQQKQKKNNTQLKIFFTLSFTSGWWASPFNASCHITNKSSKAIYLSNFPLLLMLVVNTNCLGESYCTKVGNFLSW